MRFAIFCLLTALTVPAQSWTADENTQPEMPPFVTHAGLAGVFYVLDCINEGYTSEDEVIEHGGVLYRRMDLDRSGRVSRAEYVKFASEKQKHIRHAFFDEMDSDKDDEITHLEYAKHLRAMINKADVNNDGVTHWEEVLYLRGEGELPANLGGQSQTGEKTQKPKTRKPVYLLKETL